MTHTVGTLTDFSLDENIDGLTNDSAKPLGTMDNNTAEYSTARIALVFDLDTTAANLDVDGVIELYFICSLDDTTWTDGIDPDTTSDIKGSIKHASLIKAFRADKSMAGLDISWVCPDLSLMVDSQGNKIGELPNYWSLVVWNRSGSSIQNTANNIAKYQTVTYGT